MSSLVLYCLWIESLFQLNVTDGLFGLERVFSGLKLTYVYTVYQAILFQWAIFISNVAYEG